MFPAKVRDAFDKGELELICPEMTLRQEGTETPTVYEGAGIIRLTSDRQLDFKLICPKGSDAPNLLRDLLPGHAGKAGTLLSDDSFYSLTATDNFGSTWGTAWGQALKYRIRQTAGSTAGVRKNYFPSPNRRDRIRERISPRGTTAR